jgi:hypothetical protein
MSITVIILIAGACLITVVPIGIVLWLCFALSHIQEEEWRNLED